MVSGSYDVSSNSVNIDLSSSVEEVIRYVKSNLDIARDIKGKKLSSLVESTRKKGWNLSSWKIIASQ